MCIPVSTVGRILGQLFSFVFILVFWNGLHAEAVLVCVEEHVCELEGGLCVREYRVNMSLSWGFW